MLSINRRYNDDLWAMLELRSPDQRRSTASGKGRIPVLRRVGIVTGDAHPIQYDKTPKGGNLTCR